MIKLGNLALNGTPRVAVSVTGGLSASALRKVRRWADIVEFRIDQFASHKPAQVLKELKQLKNFPSIATIRSRKEGGKWASSETARLELFKAILPEVDAVDVELSSKAILKKVAHEARRLNKILIVSHHRFDKTPPVGQLDRIAKKAFAEGADIVKIAAHARSPKDVRLLGEWTLKNNSKNIIVLAMGPEGAVSRILFPELGSLITYSYLDKPTAPGQFDCRTTRKLLQKLQP